MARQADEREQRDALRREAAGWIARLTSGEATDADARALGSWRRRSPAHEEAFRIASAAWRASAAHPEREPVPPRAALTRRRLLVGASAAGAAGLAAGVGSALGYLPSLTDLLSDYATPVGVQRRFSLPDGSRLELDAGSALNASFTPDGRRLELLRGAALFEVAPDGRSFSVASGPLTAVSHEGAFDIAAGADATRVTCLKGRVELDCGRRTAIGAGEKASYSQDRGLSDAERADPRATAAWSRGLLLIDDRPLAAAVEDINRHRAGRVILFGNIGARRVNAAFHLNRIEDAVPQLAASLGLRSFPLPGGIIVLA